MTYSRRNSLGRGGLKLATLLVLATASFVSSASPAVPAPPSLSECPLIGTMTVIAPRLPPRAIVVADLGALTVIAPRTGLVADLGTMTVSAARDVVVAHNPARGTQRAF